MFRLIPIIALIMAIFAAGLAAPCHADEPTMPVPDNQYPLPDPSGRVVLGEVRLDGVDNLPQKDLENVLEYSPRSRFQVGQQELYDPLAASRDIKRMKSVYERYGFFDVNVRVLLSPMIMGQDRMLLVYQVHEGQPTLFRSIEIRLPDQADQKQWQPILKKAAGIETGKRFSLEEYEKAKQRVHEKLADNAFPKAAVAGQVRVYPKELAADVILVVDPGPKYIFGDVTITGNKSLSDKYVRRLLKFKKGQPFSAASMSASQQTLLSSGFFATAVFVPDYQKTKNNEVPITLTLSERPAHRIRLGLGWGTEDSLRVIIEQTNRNMLGLGDEIRLEGKVSSIYQGLVGVVHIPYVPWQNTNFVLRGGVEQPNEEAYQSRNYFASPILEAQFGKYAKVWGGYLWERSIMVDLKSAVPDPVFEKQTFLISSLKGGIVFDTRNSMLNPTNGALISMEIEASGSCMGSELNFIRPIVSASQIIPVSADKRWQVALRAEAGLTITYGDTYRVPLIRRFFPGGFDSVRGYPYQRLGPLDSSGNPLGGEAMLVGNLELRFPLWQELGGVVFVDAGNAYEDIDVMSFGDLRYTAGLGLRYNTPVGPLRVDWGFQLNPDPDANIADNDFYLSVGQAF